MNEEQFNTSLRKFLKVVGVSSQREIEKAVTEALTRQEIAGNERFPATMTLEIADLKLQVRFEGQIELE